MNKFSGGARESWREALNQQSGSHMSMHVSSFTRRRAGSATGTRLLAGLALFLLSASAVQADTATIDVTGNIVAGSCSFRNNGDVVFDLGTVQANSFTSVGTPSAWVDGSMISDGCTGVTTINMTYSAPADTNNPALFAVTGGAQGVGVELQTGDNRVIVPNSSTPLPFTPQPAGGTYPFKARYVRSGTVVAGAANARITVNITYL